MRGFDEIADCSGTGLGSCSFEYPAPGAWLSVTATSDGELPTVADHSLRCAGCTTQPTGLVVPRLPAARGAEGTRRV